MHSTKIHFHNFRPPNWIWGKKRRGNGKGHEPEGRQEREGMEWSGYRKSEEMGEK